MSPVERPNILLIMADQYRHDYLGCAGADFLNTPNIDRLAAMGTRFTQCTTNIPICAPARIALASGLQPFRFGGLDNNCYLPASLPTYYQHLRDHDYRVGCVGKLDLAKPSPYNGRYGDRPSVYRWGFTHPEECEGKMHAGKSPTPLGPYGFWLQEQGLYQQFYEDYTRRAAGNWIVGQSHDSVLPTEAFADSYIGQRAADWLQAMPDDFPWHYFVSFVGPHDPFDPPTEFAERYRHAPMPDPIPGPGADKPAWIKAVAETFAADAAEVLHTQRQYCAAIEAIDVKVGLMLDALAARGQLENTYIIFTGDHGEMLGDHGLYRKHVAYEASLRVPLIVAGPGIAAGQTNDALIELIDLNPTIVELAGMPPQPRLDAQSFAPLLLGQRDDHRSEALVTYRNYRALRTDRYKFIENYNEAPELYDLQADPDEQNNIAADRPAVLRDLRRRLQERTLEATWMR